LVDLHQAEKELLLAFRGVNLKALLAFDLSDLVDQIRALIEEIEQLGVDAVDADAIGDEPVWHGGKVVGWVTSGGFAHYVDRSLAQGYVPKEIAGDTAAGAFEIEIIGENRKATIITEPLFDPKGERMRG
jgi:glycine cleavage system aminomethyltransferase T